jgi:rod shape-determining protein MreC
MFADNRFGYLEQTRYVLGYVTTPIYWVADTPTRISFWVDDVLVSRTDLIEENEYLREQLLLSQRQLQLLESLASENSRLRALQNSAQAIEGQVLPAEIINISPNPLSKRILINKGARDGVFVGQALLDANGLMGQVDEVLPFTSWVLLVTDSHHVTPVEVNRNGERALARGSRTAASELELEFVTRTQDIAPGDLLVSSGMGQVYPKDYPVAEVLSVYQDPGQPYMMVKARPLAQIDSTRNVMLVFDAKGAPPGTQLQSYKPFFDQATVDGKQPLGEDGETETPAPVQDQPLSEGESGADSLIPSADPASTRE